MTEKELLKIALDPTRWTEPGALAAIGSRMDDPVFEAQLTASLGENKAGLDPVKYGMSLRAAIENHADLLFHPLDRFHRFDRSGKPVGVFDYSIMDHILRTESILIVGGVPYIYREGVFIPDSSGTKLISMIRQCIYPEFQRSQTEKRIFDLIVRTDAIQAGADELNNYPCHWVNFKNGMYDPLARKMMPHDPKYKSINQIPHVFDPKAEPAGATIAAWIYFICPEADDRQMLMQYIGYAMTTDTRQQKFLVLLGHGGTGKSTLIRLLETVIGADNMSHISLKELSQRFAAFGLMGKLLNSCADLEVSALDDTSLLKKILGEDSLRVEAKGRDAISIHSYAKLIFSTNELPLVLNERTNGFYRRLLVLKMDEVVEEPEPNFYDQLEEEIGYFIFLAMEALHGMLERKRITESRSSKAAVMELRKDSDTVVAWIYDICVSDPDAKADRVKLYLSYQRYCDETDRTPLTKNGFYKSLKIKGYKEIKVKGTRFFRGLLLEKSCPPKLPPEWADADEETENPFVRGQIMGR